MPGDSSSSSVGARMPGANPLAASSAIFRGSLPGGRDGMNETDNEIVRAPSAATTSRPTHATTTRAATGLAVGSRATNRRARDGGSTGSGPAACASAHARAEQPRSHRAHERGHEREAHERHDERGDREAGPEDAEEVQLPGQQRERPRDDERAGGEHERRDPGGRPPRRLQPRWRRAAAAGASRP